MNAEEIRIISEMDAAQEHLQAEWKDAFTNFLASYLATTQEKGQYLGIPVADICHLALEVVLSHLEKSLPDMAAAIAANGGES